MVIAAACTDELPIPTIQPTSLPPANTATSTPEPPTLTPSPTPEPQAALVNGQPILLADYERQIARYEASMIAAGEILTTTEGQVMLAQGREWVLDMMIDQVLIEAAANQAGIAVSDEEVATSIQTDREKVGDEAFEAWLANNSMSLEELHAQQHDEMVATRMASLVAADVPTHTEQVHARHILVSTEEEAQQILSQVQAGADFVKTSTGFSHHGATVKDVKLMRRTVGPKLGVKAAGGVRSFEDAVAMVRAGATRIGTSSGVKIVSGETAETAY